MTFRAGKKHKVQESSKSNRNFVKLASRLQKFVNTGKATKQDLKAIDDQFYALLREQGDRILQLLDQLRDAYAKSEGNEPLARTFEQWAYWLSEVDSKAKTGYSSTKSVEFQEDTKGALLESAVDADADLFRLLLAFNSFLANLLRKSTYELHDTLEITASAQQIIEAYESRQKILSKIAAGSAAAKPQAPHAPDTELKAK